MFNKNKFIPIACQIFSKDFGVLDVIFLSESNG